MAKKKSKYLLAADFMKVAVDIATSKQPVTEDRLIVGEYFIELSKQLIMDKAIKI